MCLFCLKTSKTAALHPTVSNLSFSNTPSSLLSCGAFVGEEYAGVEQSLRYSLSGVILTFWSGSVGEIGHSSLLFLTLDSYQVLQKRVQARSFQIYFYIHLFSFSFHGKTCTTVKRIFHISYENRPNNLSYLPSVPKGCFHEYGCEYFSWVKIILDIIKYILITG